MPANRPFEYLPLVLVARGVPRIPPAPQAADPATVHNRANRAGHSGNLRGWASSVSTGWRARQATRAAAGLPETGVGVPLLLDIDPSLDVDELRRQFGFEIVSEHEDGFVIVASEDVDLVEFQQKLADFVATAHGSGNVAKIHAIRDDLTQDERLQCLLTETLWREWPTLADDAPYLCDVSVTCIGNWEAPNKPTPRKNWKDETNRRKEEEWRLAFSAAYQRWDELKEQRLAAAQDIIHFHGGTVLQIVDNARLTDATLPDSFTLRIRVPGRGLKDLVLNFPYVFEVAEPEEIELPQQVARDLREIEAQLDFQAPDCNAPAVCVIDSGLQEEHRWLAAAIDGESSHCFLPGVAATDIADYVSPSGHGTRVAGAVLYGERVPTEGEVALETWIQNARVLAADCNMPQELLPAAVIGDVVRQFHDGPRRTRLFNHSINADAPCRMRHMSAWAAEIDRLSNDYDVLVIQSAGNLKASRAAPRPGVAELLVNGQAHPAYLAQPNCRVANPGQSLQALTVGSVAYDAWNEGDWRSIARRTGDASAFSRAGLGLWDAIKPEVVERGGDFLRSESGDVATPSAGATCYPELIRSTRHGAGPAFSREEVGTSFAAPKVTRIAARLASLLPASSCLLYRGLIVQSARWPDWCAGLGRDEAQSVLKRIGYGLPDMDRATTNGDYRTTYITEMTMPIAAGESHVYRLPVPAPLRAPGDDFDIRIDVTMSYVAAPRRTRRNPRGYLATWLDWVSNRRGESFEAFCTRALKSDDEVTGEGEGSFGWTIETRNNWGQLRDVRRNVGTVQKDWAVLKSNALPEDLCIAVRGHEGWNRNPESTARYALTVTFDIVGEEIAIYEPLRAAVLELQAEVDARVEERLEVQIEED